MKYTRTVLFAGPVVTVCVTVCVVVTVTVFPPPPQPAARATIRHGKSTLRTRTVCGWVHTRLEGGRRAAEAAAHSPDLALGARR